MDGAGLQILLDSPGSYSAIEAAAASGELDRLLPVRLFDHVGEVYDRLERIADPRAADTAALRLAVLVHETPVDSPSRLMACAGLSDLAAIAGAVVAAFGRLWKTAEDREVADYVRVHAAHLAPLLLFELAHEGRPTLAMRRAAELGGLSSDFARWVERLVPSASAVERSAAPH